MYTLRRHYRRLLLPPGWVMLGFLLLLGCQALLQQMRKKQLPTGIQWPYYLTQEEPLFITMPPLKPSLTDTIARRSFAYKSPAELDTLRQWHDIDVIGTPLADFLNLESTISAVKAIQADTLHEGGVRIRLHQHATYVMLVKELEVMSIWNQQIYWLDILHKALTIYAITKKPSRVW